VAGQVSGGERGGCSGQHFLLPCKACVPSNRAGASACARASGRVCVGVCLPYTQHHPQTRWASSPLPHLPATGKALPSEMTSIVASAGGDEKGCVLELCHLLVLLEV